MYPLHEHDDTFAYDIDEVIEYTNRVHPRMLLLASPNNPTGNGLTPEEIGRIMENIPSDTMVLIDEAYASFISTDTAYIAPLVNKYSNLIISRTLSKFYGLPGLRVGFGFIGKGHDQFESYINKYLGYNRFSEAVALAALDSDEHYRTPIHQVYLIALTQAQYSYSMDDFVFGQDTQIRRFWHIKEMFFLHLICSPCSIPSPLRFNSSRK